MILLLVINKNAQEASHYDDLHGERIMKEEIGISSAEGGWFISHHKGANSKKKEEELDYFESDFKLVIDFIFFRIKKRIK